MTKILLYCTQLTETGGIENHILEFCQKMCSVGVEIDLIVPRFKMLDRDQQTLRDNCLNTYFYYSPQKYKSTLWLIKTLLKLRNKNYDALYTNGQGESIYIVGKLMGIPNWVHHHHSSGGKGDQETWGNQYTKALRGAKTIIACSNKNAREIEDVVGRRIDSIPCFSRDLGDSISGPLGNSDILNFGYYGRLINGKGIELICQLSNDKDCSHIVFNLWGIGDVFTPKYFEQFPNIVFHGGFKTKEELIQVNSYIDAFLLLSDSEGLPISLLEVMSAGIPWIASNKGGIKDIACSKDSTRLVEDPSDYNLIKREILCLADDIKNGRISREKQKELYKKKFAANILIDQWQSIFLM
ncbi:glycosyltransferase family 4 protein [Dysgonomonas sp. BGC7]|uniref:glycosyltransferase family 4 protein n=1 Tax=Dysgonomonas sp. BGC7 TaxID=1658008 RepID=UPI00067FE6BF|nr:glycosyltransferase family 4 protein [Dysgonomonas sp. BGC7]MBD8389759.1 glycosyltransferase family 4 protein [Dysgonomonas sp. BGC7]